MSPGNLKADFHIHTYHSLDSNLKPGSIIERAKELGLNVIGVVDHGSIEGGKETEALAGKIAKGLIVFVGEEIRTKEGEIIAFNIEENIPEGMDLIETCKAVKRLEGFLVLPHPFDRFRKGLGKSSYKIVRYVDAVEGFNARTMFDSFNRKGVRFSKENGLPVIAGSDAHFYEEIGSAFVVINSRPNKDDILEAIRAGKTKIVGTKSGMKPHLRTFFQKLRA